MTQMLLHNFSVTLNPFLLLDQNWAQRAITLVTYSSAVFPRQPATLGNLLEMQISRLHSRSKSQKLWEWGPVMVLNSNIGEGLKTLPYYFFDTQFFAAIHKYLLLINLSIKYLITNVHQAVHWGNLVISPNISFFKKILLYLADKRLLTD